MRFATLVFASALVPLSIAHRTVPTPTPVASSSDKLSPFEAAITEAPVPLEDLFASLPSQERQSQHSPKSHPKGQLSAALELLKRQNNCPASFSGCNSLGQVGLCCREGTNCSLDSGGNVGCCPTDAVCTGIVTGPPITSGTISVSDGDGVLLTGTGGAGSSSVVSTTLTDGSTGTSSQGFIIDGTGTFSQEPSRANGGFESWVLESVVFLAGILGLWM